MLPSLADFSVENLIGTIGGGATVLGGALIGLWALARKAKTTARYDDVKLTKEERLAQLEVESTEAKAHSDDRQRVIDDLRKDNDAIRRELRTLQSTTTDKLISANESHHECEKKHAALKVRFETEVEKREAADERICQLEERIKSLEQDRR